MNRRRKIIWRGILCGFLYELFFELALAARWITGGNTCSFILGVFIGIINAIIIRTGGARVAFAAIVISIPSTLLFHIIAANYFNVPLRILFYFDPLIKAIGHPTINEKMSISFIFLGYLLFSLITFTIGMVLSAIKRNPDR